MTEHSVWWGALASVAKALFGWLIRQLGKRKSPKTSSDKRRIRSWVSRFIGYRRNADGSWELGYRSERRFDQN